MTMENQAAFTTRHGMFNGEMFAAAVAAWGKGGWLEAKTKTDAIAELICRKVGAVE
jgi:hypothetical protein